MVLPPPARTPVVSGASMFARGLAKNFQASYNRMSQSYSRDLLKGYQEAGFKPSEQKGVDSGAVMGAQADFFGEVQEVDQVERAKGSQTTIWNVEKA